MEEPRKQSISRIVITGGPCAYLHGEQVGKEMAI